MTQLSAQFQQSPSEAKRYMLDYSQQLASGETITSVPAPAISSNNAPGSPALVVNNIVIAPGGLQVTYFVSGGANGFTYEVDFLATTSIGQIVEDVVAYNIVGKV